MGCVIQTSGARHDHHLEDQAGATMHSVPIASFSIMRCEVEATPLDTKAWTTSRNADTAQIIHGRIKGSSELIDAQIRHTFRESLFRVGLACSTQGTVTVGDILRDKTVMVWSTVPMRAATERRILQASTREVVQSNIVVLGGRDRGPSGPQIKHAQDLKPGKRYSKLLASKMPCCKRQRGKVSSVVTALAGMVNM